jgi:hypothetical protein
MGEFESDDLRQRYALVVEGQCPNGHGELERRDGHGWCGECEMGWSVRGRQVTNHFVVAGGEIDGRSIGPGRVRFVTSLPPDN